MTEIEFVRRMRFLAILLLFCFAVVGATLLAKVSLRGEVEAELERKVLEVLAEAGFDGVEASFDHLDGRLGGTVDRPGDAARVLALLQEQVPAAYWPEGEAGIGVRPTLPPEIRVSRAEGDGTVRIEGRLAAREDSGRSLLGARLRALANVATVENSIRLDPMVLAFPTMAEFASLASELLSHSETAELRLEEGELAFSGTVPNEGLKRALLDLAERTGATAVDDGVAVKPPASFARWSELKVTRNRFGVTLRGVLPSEADRKALRELFADVVEGPLATDHLAVADDCGRAFWQDRIAEIVPAMMAGLQGEMTAEFTRARARVSGVAEDEAVRQALLDRFASLKEEGGGAWELVADLSTPASGSAVSAAALSAVYGGGLLVLAGSVPDAAFAGALEERLERVLPDLSVKNELETVEAGPDDAWTARLVGFFAEALPRLEEGRIEIKGGEVDLEGRTLALPDRQAVENMAVNAFPTGFRIRNRLVHSSQAFPKPALLPEERTRLAEALKALPVYFDKSSEVLKAEERDKVGTIAELLEGVLGPLELLVTGVSDNIGNSESNKRLSLRRADAVRLELVRLGIPESAFTVEAEEEDVSRVARSEQWKSRRVEVSLKPAADP